MKIVVLQGSPNSKGYTNILTEEFIRGAKESGYWQYTSYLSTDTGRYRTYFK